MNVLNLMWRMVYLKRWSHLCHVVQTNVLANLGIMLAIINEIIQSYVFTRWRISYMDLNPVHLRTANYINSFLGHKFLIEFKGKD